MINKLFRAVSRVFFHIVRSLLRLLEATIPRLYMLFYCYLLQMYGLKLNGYPRYISTKVNFDDLDKVVLGERVVLSANVTMLTHDYSITTGLIAIGKLPPTDVASVKPIIVGNNVFVGMGSFLLPGTTIEDNVIIGAGSVVRGTIPTNSIVIGNPAQVVGKLTEKACCWERNIGSGNMRVD